MQCVSAVGAPPTRLFTTPPPPTTLLVVHGLHYNGGYGFARKDLLDRSFGVIKEHFQPHDPTDEASQPVASVLEEGRGKAQSLLT